MAPLCLRSPNEKKTAYVNTDIKMKAWWILLERNVLFGELIMHNKHRLHDLNNITAWCSVWGVCVNVFRGVCGVIDDVCSVIRPCKVLFLCVSMCLHEPFIFRALNFYGMLSCKTERRWSVLKEEWKAVSL